MDKINFVNLPSTTTPINATNLNQLQTNVDNAKVEKTVSLTSQDLNNQKTTGFYYCLSCTNKPSDANNGYLMVIKYTDNYVKQFFSSVTSNTTYERLLINGTWGSWQGIGAEKVTIFSNTNLSNDWSTNGQCNCVTLQGGTKILTMSIRYGTSTSVMTLPTALRPSSAVLAVATTGSSVGYVSIATTGAVTLSSGAFSSGGSCMFSATYQ